MKNSIDKYDLLVNNFLRLNLNKLDSNKFDEKITYKGTESSTTNETNNCDSANKSQKIKEKIDTKSDENSKTIYPTNDLSTESSISII